MMEVVVVMVEYKKNIISSYCDVRDARSERDGMYNKNMLKVQTRINRE